MVYSHSEALEKRAFVEIFGGTKKRCSAAHLLGQVHELRDGEDAIERPVVRVDDLNVNGVQVALVELPGDGVRSVEHPVDGRRVEISRSAAKRLRWGSPEGSLAGANDAERLYKLVQPLTGVSGGK